MDGIDTLTNSYASGLKKGLALASFFPMDKVIKGGKFLTKVVRKNDIHLSHFAIDLAGEIKQGKLSWKDLPNRLYQEIKAY